jgi:hypothetical protein
MLIKNAIPLVQRIRLFMAKAFTYLLITSVVCSSSMPLSAATQLQPQNIVYIMLDDADYFDVGYNNGSIWIARSRGG